MTSVLCVTWDGGGNLPPMHAIATEVTRRGGTARFLGHPGQRAAVEAAGLPFEQYLQARSWSVLDRRAGLRADLGYAAVFTDRGIGRDAVASQRREPADRILVDGLLVGAMTHLGRAEVPYAVLVHTLRSVMYGALTGGPLGAIVRLTGHNARASYARAQRELVMTDPGLDPGSAQAPPTARYLGPVLPPLVEPVTAEAPATVVVSLSTTYVHGQTEVLQRIVDALSALPVRVLVSTGPSIDPGAVRAAPNTDVHAYLPHAEVLAGADLLVGHGGHGTTMLALACGVPVLVIPTNRSFDQPVIGRVVAEHGLGRTLRNTASVEQVRDACTEILGDPRFRERARELAPRLHERSAAAAAAELLLG